MPLFEYHCRDCGQQFEILILGGTSEPVRCPHCSSEQVAKLLSAPCRPISLSSSPPAPSAGCPARGGFT